jgi:Ca2+-binding RTX toxin-like protein
LNNNGTQDSDEPALGGWTINLFVDTNTNGVFDSGTDALVDTQVTDVAGNYSFVLLPDNTFFVREVVLTGFTLTTPPRDVTLSGQAVVGQDFGNLPPATSLIPDPVNPSNTALLVVGVPGNDKISFKTGKPAGSITVKMNKQSQTFSPTGHIIAYGMAGDDSIKVDKKISLSAWLFGGAGDDTATGGNGNDYLSGDSGDDNLNGGGGRNVQVGGLGADNLTAGGSGGDILIAGTTDFSANDEAISKILAEWSSAGSYATRVAHLRGTTAGGLNEPFFLTGGASGTVHDDVILDALKSGKGQEWFLAHTTGITIDTLKKRASNEFVDDI